MYVQLISYVGELDFSIPMELELERLSVRRAKCPAYIRWSAENVNAR